MSIGAVAADPADSDGTLAAGAADPAERRIVCQAAAGTRQTSRSQIIQAATRAGPSAAAGSSPSAVGRSAAASVLTLIVATSSTSTIHRRRPRRRCHPQLGYW